MSDTLMTVVGNVVDEPRYRTTESNIPILTFRVASSSRRKRDGQWVDTDRLFVNVTCWRAMAQNAFESLRKGQPVVVMGRYYSREYRVEETVRVSYQLEAYAIGHDLARGTSTFARVNRPFAPTTVEATEDGMPVDASDAVFGVPDDGLGDRSADHIGPEGPELAEADFPDRLIGVG